MVEERLQAALHLPGQKQAGLLLPPCEAERLPQVHVHQHAHGHHAVAWLGWNLCRGWLWLLAVGGLDGLDGLVVGWSTCVCVCVCVCVCGCFALGWL
jgi:hypothetical protein